MILKVSLHSEVVILPVQEAVLVYTSCFEYVRPYYPFTIASFYQPFLWAVAALIKRFIIRTNPEHGLQDIELRN